MPCNPEEAWVTFIHTWYTFVHTAATDACDTVTKTFWRLYLENDEEPMRAEHIVALLASRGVPRYAWISITLSRSREKVRKSFVTVGMSRCDGNVTRAVTPRDATRLIETPA